MKVDPKEQVIEAANEFTDSRGRKIVLKEPNRLKQMGYVLASDTENKLYIAMLTPYMYIVSVDGVKEPTPTNRLQIDALISRIGDETADEITLKIGEMFPPKSIEEYKDAVKKQLPEAE